MYLRNKVRKFVHVMVLMASLTFERVYNAMRSIIRRTVTTGFVKTFSHNTVGIKNTKYECTFVRFNVNDNEMLFYMKPIVVYIDSVMFLVTFS